MGKKTIWDFLSSPGWQNDKINSLVKEATDAMADHDDKMEPINGKKRKGTSEGSRK